MKRTSLVLPAMVLVLSLFALYGCPKSTEVSSEPELKVEKKAEAPAEDMAAKEAAAKAEEERRAAEAAAAARARAAEEEKSREAAAKGEAGLQPIYFDFDKSFIRDDAKAAMKANAEYLKAHPKAKIRIEGNCDERGTIEYNQALGQRRATSARKYLADLGISGKRITLISYGKERPICTESNEDCWQKNRRGDFVIATR